jgi:hypothetical protein
MNVERKRKREVRNQGEIVDKILVWPANKMAEIIHDAAAICADRSLRPLSDGSPVRRIGHWEAMRLDQAALILAGNVYM